VPRALSDISMHLLAKTPGTRPASAKALLQSLWEAKKEAKTHAWRVPLPMPPEGIGRQRQGAEQAQRVEAMHEEALAPALEEGLGDEGAQEKRSAGVVSRARVGLELIWAFTPWHVRWVLAVLALLLALRLIWAALAPQPLKGSAPVSTHAPQLSRLLVLLCTYTGLGCPGAQVKPPEAEACPAEAKRVMFEELKLTEGSPLRAIVDVQQPGDQSELGTYRDGPLTGRVTRGEGGLPEGTVLRGKLWTGPGIYEDSIPPAESVIARYTSAKLPDGREVPVCIVLGGPDGRVPKAEGSSAEAVSLPRELPANAVRRWP
jgi:serine/threonine-protein kinase